MQKGQIFCSQYQYYNKNNLLKDVLLIVHLDRIVLAKGHDPDFIKEVIQFRKCRCVFEWRLEENCLKLHFTKKAYKLKGDNLIQLKKLLDGKVLYDSFLKHYKLGQLVYQSERVRVFNCKDQSGTQFAAKIYERKFDEYVDPLIVNELNVHQNLQLDCKPNLNSYYQHDKNLVLIFDFIDGQTLKDYLKQKYYKLGNNIIRKIIKRLLKILVIFQQHGLVHRDIHPGNIILRNNDLSQLTIIDFKSSILIEDDEKIDVKVSTPGYMAPELFRDEHDYTSDVFSVGAIFHILLTKGLRIFPNDKKNGYLLKANSESKIRISQKIDNEDALDLVKQMLQVNQRPSAEQCLKHNYFKIKQENPLIAKINSMTTVQIKNPFFK